ncbi:branched-chain amino acid ABC transporter substrate-binding protein [Achromobacter sp. HZ28]|nr:branched-chain amino acid ABC transporter substrate-binding protein [Achromobacter sp. HZ34]OWT81464.1 branched-chain amino acid ABC transporter substrate-binding protein [Achromobacter sp. HZ28]
MVGVSLSLTGRANVLGLQSRNAVRLWPLTLGGLPARYVVLDDAGEPARALANMRAFTESAGDDKAAGTNTGTGPGTAAGQATGTARADAVVGFVTTPLAQAVLPAAARTRTPLIFLAGTPGLVQPMDADRAWVFKMSQNDDLMARALVDSMVRRGYHDIAFLGFDDAYGEDWRQALHQAAAGKLNIVAEERYPRGAQALVGQAQRIIAAKPAAVLIAATGADAVLPQRTLRERGFSGQVYQTHGIATPNFLQEGVEDVEGTLFAAGPAMFVRTLPPEHPARSAAVAFADLYEGQYGKGTVTQFSADAYGAWQLLDHAVATVTRAGLHPGTEAFRVALREALENTRGLAVPNGTLNLSPTNHQGLGPEAVVIGGVRGGQYIYPAE